jgi:hypothetical protein
MRLKPVLLGLLAIGVGSLIWTAAMAQVPPHQPGTVCFTPRFWCWAQPPGPPGLPCACWSQRGWVGGTLG